MVSHKNLSIMVSAGEASSDAHAAHALDALRAQGVAFESFGMGAGALGKCGTELVVDCRDLAVIGFVDVLINYPKFLKRLRKLREHLQERKPDLLLLVDYPDFN
ncbi:MAG: lipid-A-disaccharide synthase, partial [Patiriisocius sp.]